MQCGCIKNIYNAYVSNNGCKELIYEDSSLWMEETGYSIPESYDVTITTPNGAVKTLDLKVGCRNKITSADLFTSNGLCLEDGIYCFEVESCGVKYKINKAFLCNTECSLSKFIALNDNLDKVVYYNSLIEAVKSNAELGNVIEANKILDYLNRQFENLNCENC